MTTLGLFCNNHWRNEMNKLMGVLLLSTMAASSVVLADDKCKEPLDQWQTEAAFRQVMEQKGWTIQTFEIDDGCFEIHGLDENQRRIEASFNPKTLEMVEMELED